MIKMTSAMQLLVTATLDEMAQKMFWILEQAHSEAKKKTKASGLVQGQTLAPCDNPGRLR